MPIEATMFSMSLLIGRLNRSIPKREISKFISNVWMSSNKVEDREKVSSLRLVGSEGYKMLKDLLTPDTPNTKSYVELKAALQKQSASKSWLIMERYKLYSRSALYDQHVVCLLGR